MLQGKRGLDDAFNISIVIFDMSEAIQWHNGCYVLMVEYQTAAIS